jgi:hypothetical protein
MSLLFFSGRPGMPSKGVQRQLYSKVEGRLLSLHKEAVSSSEDWLELANHDKFGFDTSNMELMFDSGAFTAWTKQEPPIDVNWLLDQYLKFDRRAGDRFKIVWFISLDVIPGALGRDPTNDEIREAIRHSDANHRVLRAEFGNRVIPVYHQREPVERLHEVIEINPLYVGISPENGILEDYRWQWARNVHLRLKDAIETRGLKTHGLATTGSMMLEAVDWRSVDSTSWVWAAKNGRIIFEWEGQRRTLPISAKSPAREKFGASHYDIVPDDRVRKLVDEICAELEITSDMLRAHHYYRYLFNVHTLVEWSKRPYARDKLA